MVRLLLKIFIAYWVAAGVVIILSDADPHRHIHNPELTDALDSSLALNGRMLVQAYETGRCAEVEKQFNTRSDGLYLATPDGHVVCGDPEIPDASLVVASAVQHKKRMTANYERFQLIASPIKSQSGKNYVLLFKNGYSSALHFYGLLPGYVTMSISCVVTLFLAVLMALPIRRLREAAGEISRGRLDTRVKCGVLTARWPGLTGGDDIDQLMRDFNHMAERYESLANAQRLLLRDVSHELRSPLTRLGVGVGLARADSPAAIHEHLDRIDEEAERLNRLIGQILSLSQLDMLQGIEVQRVISLSEIVLDLLPHLEYEAAQSNCAIRTSMQAGCYVQGDEDLIRSALENVVRNAIKYAPGNGFICIDTANEERLGVEFSVVRVSDSGPGIPEHELQSVLKPFYRADRSRHWQQEGSGIGLAIADHAARLHRGIIGVRNKEEGGLIVEICLPKAPSSQLGMPVPSN